MSAAEMARRIADECGSSTPVVLAGTQRQQEIIALVAAGLTNRQIAARLVMSVRTVEGHLSPHPSALGSALVKSWSCCWKGGPTCARSVSRHCGGPPREAGPRSGTRVPEVR
ncbi:response regulator transcription factor [Mycolicibacterium mengxianglii]|uniref:response regulator transcription factor n=1 Tax=Mycolicibacterium mengxianglii TaxID=2736649 RepID=UPI0027DA78FD|nr:helix-turn-helix transcriptional regulator [Mycolicibacterium mengxianglii]